MSPSRCFWGKQNRIAKLIKLLKYLPPFKVRDMSLSKFLTLIMVAVLGASASILALPVASAAESPKPEPAAAQCGATNRNANALSPDATMSNEGKDAFTGNQPRLILALSGGAFKAVAEIGVLRSLEQHHIKIDGIVGTSMGATIGALYCAGMSVDDIEKMFLDGTVRRAMFKGVRWSVITRPLTQLTNLCKVRPYPGITDGSGYLQFLQRKLPKSFEELKIPFAAVATNITDGQTTALAHGDLPRSVLASNCIPTLYRPVFIDGKLYVDGGLKANLPSNIAQSIGSDIVVAVLVDTAVTSVPNKSLKSKKALMVRVMNIMMASADKIQSQSSDTLIYPDVDFVPATTKDPEILRRGIAAGQKAADSVSALISSELLALRKKLPPQENSASAKPSETGD
jgi:NTE family protein